MLVKAIGNRSGADGLEPPHQRAYIRPLVARYESVSKVAGSNQCNGYVSKMVYGGCPPVIPELSSYYH